MRNSKGQFVKGNKNTKTAFKKGSVGFNKGKKFSKEWKEKMSVAKKGKPAGHGYSKEVREKIGKAHKGENNYNWKGGISLTKDILRKGSEYRLWRKAVLERDEYKCVECGFEYKKVGDLHVDHIKPIATHPELRVAIDNGRALCAKCHYKTNTYGGKINSKNFICL